MSEQLYQRNSCTVKKVLGSTTDFPTWGSSKRTKNTQGIWLWRPVEFDYRISPGLGNKLLEGTNKTVCAPGARKKEQSPHKRLSQTCLWGCKSLWWGVGWQWPAAGSGALNTTMHTWALSKEVIITFITPTIVWTQAKGREHSPTH